MVLLFFDASPESTAVQIRDATLFWSVLSSDVVKVDPRAYAEPESRPEQTAREPLQAQVQDYSTGLENRTSSLTHRQRRGIGEACRSGFRDEFVPAKAKWKLPSFVLTNLPLYLVGYTT
jgi:hypothetical protein